ncbi:MAG: LLM class flavin-dependent oxidoreductase [Microthrixaceae bacterium]
MTPSPLPPLSVLDLAVIRRDQTAGEALAGCVELARRAEEHGYGRVWYAEHHNMTSVGSSAPAVLVAHVAANTRTIRLGAGGVMLPNHRPLTVAEQFGTLAELHPGRIDLGLGRAPGTDQVTAAALGTTAARAERFPEEVLELQAFLGDRSRVPGVRAVPGRGTHVPLYILGSSLFGARLAAHLGLPYAFASHFAPQALQAAVALYRAQFQPSEQAERPYVLAAVNVVAAPSDEEARARLDRAVRSRVVRFLAPDAELSDAEVDALVASPQGRQIVGMMEYTAAGDPAAVREQLAAFALHADADELITVHAAATLEQRLESVELTAAAAHA